MKTARMNSKNKGCCVQIRLRSICMTGTGSPQTHAQSEPIKNRIPAVTRMSPKPTSGETMPPQAKAMTPGKAEAMPA